MPSALYQSLVDVIDVLLGQLAVHHPGWDTGDSHGNHTRWPRQDQPTAQGTLAAVQGGLTTDASLRPRVSAILGPGCTLRGLAAEVQRFYASATPPAAPTAHEVAQAIAVYNRHYLPVPAMNGFKAGLRLPLPIEIEPGTGRWVLNSDLVRTWSASFDPAWAPALDQRVSALPHPNADDLPVDAFQLLTAHLTPAARATQLAGRLLTNPFETVYLAFEVIRQLGHEAFAVTLALLDGLVTHQVELLASLTGGWAVLARLENVLSTPPANLSPADAASLARARTMLGNALRPGGVRAVARELPETPQQLASRGQVPAAFRGAAQEPATGEHRMVLGRDVTAGTVGVYPAQPNQPRYFRGAAYVGRIPPGPFIAARRGQLNPLGSPRLEARLDILIAIAPNEGALDAVRMQDMGIVSSGIQQWSAHVNTEITVLLARLKDIAPDEFLLHFAQYGLDVAPMAPDANGNPRFMLRRIQPNGVAVDVWGAGPAAGTHETQSARWRARRDFFAGATAGNTTTWTTTWAARFRSVSIASDGYRRAQVLVGADRFDRIVRDAPNVAVQGNPVRIQDLVTCRLLAALTLDQHINAPGNVGPDLQAAVNAVGAQPTIGALEQAVTARLAGPLMQNPHPPPAQHHGAPNRHLADAARRTTFIMSAGLDGTPGSFGGW
jgi:hypothetical protein